MAIALGAYNPTPFYQNFMEMAAANAARKNPATTTGSPSAQLALPASNYSPYYGGLPAVASPTAAAEEAVRAGQALLPGLGRLASQSTQANQAQSLEQLRAGLPGYNDLVSQSSANIGAALRGEVPRDEADRLQRLAAERGIGKGIPGAPAINYYDLLSYGLTSLGQKEKGEQFLTQAIGRTPTVQPFNVQSWMAAPGTIEAAQNQANWLAAAPIPSYAQQSNMASAGAGLRQGYATGYGAGSSGYGNLSNNGVGGGNTQNDMAALLDSIINRYGPGTGSQFDNTGPVTAPPSAPAAAPAQPGWGYLTNSSGYYSAGDVPPSEVPPEFRYYQAPGSVYGYENYFPENSMY